MFLVLVSSSPDAAAAEQWRGRHACWKMLMAASALSGFGRRPETTVTISPDHHSPSITMAAQPPVLKLMGLRLSYSSGF